MSPYWIQTRCRKNRLERTSFRLRTAGTLPIEDCEPFSAQRALPRRRHHADRLAGDPDAPRPPGEDEEGEPVRPLRPRGVDAERDQGSRLQSEQAPDPGAAAERGEVQRQLPDRPVAG